MLVTREMLALVGAASKDTTRGALVGVRLEAPGFAVAAGATSTYPNPHAVYLVQAWRDSEHARFGQECIADANVQGLHAARIKAGSWLAQTYPDASSVRIMDMVADYCEVTPRWNPRRPELRRRCGTFAQTTLVSLEDTIL